MISVIYSKLFHWSHKRIQMKKMMVILSVQSNLLINIMCTILQRNFYIADDSEFLTPPSSPSQMSNSDSENENDMDLADDSIQEEIFLEGYVILTKIKALYPLHT